jgi:hypothetical protein
MPYALCLHFQPARAGIVKSLCIMTFMHSYDMQYEHINCTMIAFLEQPVPSCTHYERHFNRILADDDATQRDRLQRNVETGGLFRYSRESTTHAWSLHWSTSVC